MSGPFDNTTISNNDIMRTGVARITLGAGATSSIDLWVGSDDTTAVNISGASDATLGGLDLEGVDTLRLAAGTADVLYDDLILGDNFVDVGAVPEPSSSLLLSLGGLAFVLRRRK